MLSEQELLDIAKIPLIVESLNIGNKYNYSGYQIYRKSDGMLFTHDLFRTKGWAERHLIDYFRYSIQKQFMDALGISCYQFPQEISFERGTIIVRTLFDQFEIRKV